MGKGAWQDFNPPDDGTWVDLKPNDGDYDHAYAAHVADLDPMEAPFRDDDGLPRLDIVFGSQLGWAPYREGGTLDLSFVAPDGEACIVAVCCECGSGLTRDTLPDRAVCGGCYRSSLDVRIKSLLARAS